MLMVGFVRVLGSDTCALVRCPWASEARCGIPALASMQIRTYSGNVDPDEFPPIRNPANFGIKQK